MQQKAKATDGVLPWALTVLVWLCGLPPSWPGMIPPFASFCFISFS